MHAQVSAAAALSSKQKQQPKNTPLHLLIQYHWPWWVVLCQACQTQLEVQLLLLAVRMYRSAECWALAPLIGINR